MEPLSGYLHLAQLLYKDSFKGPNNHILRNEAYNFGPPSSVCNTVEEVVQSLQKYWDNFNYKIEVKDSIAKECNLLKLCCDKALAYLGWEANLTFDETMKFTATWYKEFETSCNNESSKVLDLSLGQIQEYTKLAKQRNRVWAI